MIDFLKFLGLVVVGIAGGGVVGLATGNHLAGAIAAMGVIWVGCGV